MTTPGTHARTHARRLPCGAARDGAGAFQAAAARTNAAGCRRQRHARLWPAAAARARGFFRPLVRYTPPLPGTIHPHTFLQTLRHVAVPPRTCATHRPSGLGPRRCRGPAGRVQLTGCAAAVSIAARPRSRRRRRGPRLPPPRRLAAPRRPGPPQQHWLRRTAAGRWRLGRDKPQTRRPGRHCSRR
jgi:hypothetical protein